MQAKGDATSADEARGLLEDAVAFAGVSKYPARVKCALMGWMAFKDAASAAASARAHPTAADRRAQHERRRPNPRDQG